jgi:hypothetical protein
MQICQFSTGEAMGDVPHRGTQVRTQIVAAWSSGVSIRKSCERVRVVLVDAILPIGNHTISEYLPSGYLS